MGTRSIAEHPQSKIGQLDQTDTNTIGYLYSCSLCEEFLVLSRSFINPRRVHLVFYSCPGCGFELQRTLRVQPYALPYGKRFFMNQACKDVELLIEPDELFDARANRGRTLTQERKPDLATGNDRVDRSLVLRLGQLVSLQGEPSNALSHLLCARAIYPLPPGLDSDVVFVDGGNLFDSYTISQHAFRLGLDGEKTKDRIHLSRAFTHHQLSGLIFDKLPTEIDQYKAQLAIVSDITALYCDPDIREKKEAFDLFSRDVISMARLAKQKKMIIVVTNLQSRSRRMEDFLERNAHVSATLRDEGDHNQLRVVRHLFLCSDNGGSAGTDDRGLTRYLNNRSLNGEEQRCAPASTCATADQPLRVMTARNGSVWNVPRTTA